MICIQKQIICCVNELRIYGKQSRTCHYKKTKTNVHMCLKGEEFNEITHNVAVNTFTI